ARRVGLRRALRGPRLSPRAGAADDGQAVGRGDELGPGTGPRRQRADILEALPVDDTDAPAFEDVDVMPADRHVVSLGDTGLLGVAGDVTGAFAAGPSGISP